MRGRHVRGLATCGGLALANAGLGAVHGFAVSIEVARPCLPARRDFAVPLLPAVLASHVEKAKAGTQVHTG